MTGENGMNGPLDGVPCFVVGLVAVIDVDTPLDAIPTGQKQLFWGPASNVECGGWIVKNSERFNGVGDLIKVELFTVVPENYAKGLPWAPGMDQTPIDLPAIEQHCKNKLSWFSLDELTGDTNPDVLMERIVALREELDLYRQMWMDTCEAHIKLLRSMENLKSRY